ncbi:MAG: serine/threonine-protein kinase [Myxococcota bacterium]
MNLPTGPIDDGDATLLAEDSVGTRRRDHDPQRLARGAAVDRYVIVDELGSGGMGVVYVAYDPELDRRVAIKILHDDLVRDGRTRLIREAQAIARISHPNVVAVHDVGEISGSVFVAMELVEGQTLSQWLAAEPRSIPEILAVFIQAGEGLAAAHAAELVHRDFKPDNALRGHDGRVRVLDFGLARGRGSDDSLGPAEQLMSSNLDLALTEAGAVMGTPAYMSPEQLGGQVATAASDQFAFCVALYEALYGERPFASDTFESLATAVLQGEVRDPPADRKVPSRLRQVVMRGLRNEPSKRHPSMHALLQQLRHDPGQRRRRIGMAAGVVAGGVLVAALAYRSGARGASPCKAAGADIQEVWNEQRAEAIAKAFHDTELAYADDTWSRVKQHLDPYAEAWSSQAVEACKATHVTHQQSSDVLDARRRCLNERLLKLDAFVEVIADPNPAVVDGAVRSSRALPDLDGCSDIVTLLSAVPPPDDEEVRTEVDAIDEALTRAEALSAAARYREQLVQLKKLVARAEATGYRPIIARVMHALSGAQLALDEPEGPATLRRALNDALAAGDDRLAAMAATDLAYQLGYEEQLHGQGLEWAAIAHSLVERQGGADDILIGILNAQAVIASSQAHYDEAREYFEQMLAKQREDDPDSPNLSVGLMNLGSYYAGRRDFDKATENIEKAAAHTERILGPQHPRMTRLWANLAMVALMRGRYEEAEKSLEKTLALQRTVLGERSVEYARSIASMAVAQRNLGRPGESERLHRQALETRRELLGPDHPSIAESKRNLAHAIRDQKRFEEALGLVLEAKEIATRRLAPDHPEHAINGASAAIMMAEAGRYSEAKAEALRTIELQEARKSTTKPLFDALRALAWAQRELGETGASVETMERALKQAVEADSAEVTLAQVRLEAGMCMVAAGQDVAQAQELVSQALTKFEDVSGGYARDLQRLKAWRAEHPWPAPGN